MIDVIITPFTEHGYMARALVACLAISIGAAPLGVFMVLRRMALIGDAMQHAILPGVAVAYLMAGLSLWPMTVGGLIAGVVVAALAGFVTRNTPLKEDASFTGVYLISIALGVVLVSLKGDVHELEHILFGDVKTMSNQAVIMIVSAVSISTFVFAIIYRMLVVECFDPNFMKVVSGKGGVVYQLFLLMVVMNLVAAFHALGTLMALGLMVLPAVSARLWIRDVEGMIFTSVIFSIISSVVGLLVSFHSDTPSGATIVLVGGGIYILSVLFGRTGGVLTRLLPHKHLKG
ncbi:MAG: metal ABC transporter permease [Alphaproteobacteria bacterium]